jgi:hypothetical protein
LGTLFIIHSDKWDSIHRGDTIDYRKKLIIYYENTQNLVAVMQGNHMDYKAALSADILSQDTCSEASNEGPKNHKKDTSFQFEYIDGTTKHIEIIHSVDDNYKMSDIEKIRKDQDAGCNIAEVSVPRIHNTHMDAVKFTYRAIKMSLQMVQQEFNMFAHQKLCVGNQLHVKLVHISDVSLFVCKKASNIWKIIKLYKIEVNETIGQTVIRNDCEELREMIKQKMRSTIIVGCFPKFNMVRLLYTHR